MNKYLIQYLSEKTSMDEESIVQIASHFELLKTKRKEIIEMQSQICKNLYFINKGCLRLYEVDKKRNEITAYFAFENSFITPLTSFITQKPSRDFLMSLENSEILKVDRAVFFNLTETHPQFKSLYNQMIEFALIHSQMRIYSFLGMEGIDKLKWVIEHEPKLLTRIPSNAVASYLGMTNSTLSKLKAKL